MLDVGRGEKGHAVDIIILIMNASIQISKKYVLHGICDSNRLADIFHKQEYRQVIVTSRDIDKYSILRCNSGSNSAIGTAILL